MESPYGTIPSFFETERQSQVRSGNTGSGTSDWQSCISHATRLNAFIEVFEEPISERPGNIAPGILNGMMVAVKDNICIEGHPASCGSDMLKDVRAPRHASAVERLLANGAAILGRTNMDEFGMGSSTEYSAFGPVLNPLDVTRVAGGSSGGSAVAVATGAVHAAVGSDTGGSVRQPAAFTGIVGFKPSYGRISRNGLVAFSSSCDQIGIMARSVEDVSLVFASISGEDPLDASTVSLPAWDEFDALHSGIEDLRFAIPAEYLPDDLQPECRDVVVRALTRIMALGAEASGVHLPATKYAVGANYVIANAEASANLARYDGIRYSGSNADSFQLPAAVRSERFGPEVRRRLMLGAHVTADGGERYRRAMQVRRKIVLDFEKAFQKADILITPATAGTAFKLGERDANPRAMYLSDTLNTPANMAGIPAISIPAGKDAEGMPVGLQLMAKPMNETALFRAAVTLMEGMDKL